MISQIICKAITRGNNISYSSVTVSGVDIASNILNDKKYGFLQPKNGILTYSISNKDGEISERGVKMAVAIALTEWAVYTPIKFKYVPINGNIQVKFMSEEDDKILDKSTLAYMYFPMGGVNNGKCVVNTRFFWTNSGKAVNMNLIDPIHYPDASKAPVQGESHDLDQVLRHEFGHGVFGLPHSQNKYKIMSAGYGIMLEHLDDEDIIRAQSKAGSSDKSPSMIKRIKEYLIKKSDKDY